MHAADTPLGSGFRYRLVKELVNAGAYADAGQPLSELQEAFRTAYGIDLATPEAISLPEPGTLSFPELARRFPFNLCGVLYCQGIMRLTGGDAVAAAASFGAAAAFARVLRAALQAIGTDDGETEDLGARAVLEQCLAVARVDAQAALRRFAPLTQDAPQDIPPPLIEQTRQRLIVTLVNIGAYESALTLVTQADWQAKPENSAADRRHDALSLLFVLGMLALNHKADYQTAARCFHSVYDVCRGVPESGVAHALLWPARFHEALALSHDQATREQAVTVALDLLHPGDPRFPEVPAPHRAWAKQLLTE